MALLAAALLLSAAACDSGTDSYSGFITSGQYADVRLGQVRSEVLEQLGQPFKAAVPYPAPSGSGLTYLGRLRPPRGSTCDYYEESNAIQDPGIMRFCYRDQRLVEKGSWSIEASVGFVCEWRAGDKHPACVPVRP